MKNVSNLPERIIQSLKNKTITDVQGNEYRIDHILRPPEKEGFRLFITKDISTEEAIRLIEFLDSLERQKHLEKL
jgi:hypothetical protein